MMVKTNRLRRPAASRRSNSSMILGWALASAVASAPFAFAAAPQGAPRGGARAAGTPAPAAADSTSGAGLDALSDETVMTDLAARGQETLLNRMFDARKVPQAQRDRIVGLKAIEQLVESTRANAAPLGNNQRLKLVRESVAGLANLLPTLKNPDKLMTYAGALVTLGVEPDVDTLEYWGESSVTQARVRPVAKMASDMLQKVSVDAEAEHKRIEAAMKVPNDKQAERWMELYELANNSKYFDAMIQYYLALATDVSGNNQAAMAARTKIADDAMKYLEQFDAPAEDPKAGGIQPLVRLRRAKLAMAKKDFETAKQLFQTLVTGKMEDGKPIVPAPTPLEQYQARYFSAQSDVLAGKYDQAEKALPDLEKNVPPELPGGGAAALQMLKFRLLSGKSDATQDPKQKADLETAAATILRALGEKHPQFRALITEQLVSRLPENADLTQQPPLVLQALVARGAAERSKPEGTQVDTKILERAAKAAEMLAGMKPTAQAQGGLTDAMIEDAALAVPLFYDRLGRKLEATKGYLAYAAKYQKFRPKDAGEAVDRAFTLAYEAYRAQPSDAAVKQVYGQAIKTAAYQPYGRRELFYLTADYFRTVENNFGEAVKFYSLVPRGDKAEFPARFFALVALKSQADAEKDPAKRQAVLQQMPALIDQVRALAAARGDDPIAKGRLALTTLLGADLAIQQKAPERALQLLEGLEQSVASLPNAGDVALEATRYRALAYLASNQLDKATAEVIRLASDPKTATQAIILVNKVLEELRKDYDRAEAAGNTAEMSRLASGQASLTKFLVDWARTNLPKKIGEFLVYDADIKLNAGRLQKDPAQKKQLLDSAIAVYTEAGVTAPDNVKVPLGLGLAQYEMGNYAESDKALGTLLRENKLGGPQAIDTDAAGNQNVKDNPVYWEAMYKWLKGKAQILKGDPNNVDAKSAVQTLKNLYITHRERLGGENWKKQFDELRQELIPEFKLEELGPTTAPTTAPVAAGDGR